MVAAKRSPGPKQVVYLWGAGATQGEVTYAGAKVNLLMQDQKTLGPGVATRILQQLPKKWRPSFVTDQGTDIEKLISLLASSDVAEYLRLAGQIRRLYFEDICRTLSEAKVLTTPKLALGLLELHNIEEFKKQELLCGIITTNHDGLLQRAVQQVHGSVNIGFSFQSTDLTNGATPTALLLQVHGSFTWTFGVPIIVSLLRDTSGYAPDTVWMPPSIVKESKSYPFNKLAGMAYEILSKQCDVLRIVGSSLTQNDWNILSMIFNAQRHRGRTKRAPFRIELIMPQYAGEFIVGACSYLQNLVPIGHLTDGNFAEYKDPDALAPDMENPLFYWLREKTLFHRRRGDFVTAAIGPELGAVVGDAP